MIKIAVAGKKLRVNADCLDQLRNHFSVDDPNNKFKQRFAGRRYTASRRYYCITPTGLFEPGMFFDIVSFLTNNINDTIEVDPAVYTIVKPSLSDCIVFDNLTKQLRDYQLESIKNVLNIGRGIVKIGTGGGKTLIISSILSSIFNSNNNFKCLIIVPTLNLVTQTYDDFNEYGVPFTFTKWSGDNVPDFSVNCVIAGRNILQTQFEQNQHIKDVDIVIIDEVHMLKKDNKICSIIESIQTPNKIGFTGTLPEQKIDEWKLKGLIGCVVYSKNSASLIQEDYLTQCHVTGLRIDYKNGYRFTQGEDRYRKELEFIYTNKYRNSLICKIAANSNKNTLILVNHLLHGEQLLETMQELQTGKQVFFVRGEMEVNERDRVKKVMEHSDDVVCIAMSSIFSTGINITNIHYIVFGSGGKSFIRIIQSIGRGLRLHESKEKLSIIDIVDNLEYSNKHNAARQQIYKQESITYSERLFTEK